MKKRTLLIVAIILITVSVKGFSQTIVVTTSTDSIAGSLREAINNAQSGDTIIFNQSLTEIILGEKIDINKSLTIKGNPNLIICGRGADGIFPRVFEITGDLSITVNFDNCNLFKTGFHIGETVSYNTDGGVILIRNISSTVNINSCYFKRYGGFGGTVQHYQEIPNGQNGGAIANYGGELNISNSTFSGLTAGGPVYNGNGGAICQLSGQLNLINCTFYDNSVGDNFSSNFPYIGRGSAIYSQNGNLEVTNCTFCEHTNSYTYFKPAPDYGSVTRTTSTIILNNSNLFIKNSIFFNDDNRDLAGDVNSHFISDGYNIFDQTISISDGASPTDIFNVNPGFNLIGANGYVGLDKSFWIPVCALDAAGLAIDALPADGNGAPKFDQRGHNRINTPDIGAFESEICIPTDMRAKWSPSKFGQDSWAYDMSVVDDKIVWVKDINADSISITTDGGASWVAKKLPTSTGAAGGICALSATNAYFILSTSNLKGIYMTTDGGDNWSKQTTGFNQSSSFPDVIHFWNENEGVAIGDASPNPNFEIYTTSNGGTQWNRVPDSNMPAGNNEGTYNSQESFKIVGNSILFLTNTARIFKSDNKGDTWSVINTPFHNSIDSTISFDFKDNSNGIISYCSNDGLQHKMYKTTNGGQTWDSISTTNYYQRIKYIPALNAYCSMDINGGLSYSCNDGQTWTSVSYFNYNKIRSVGYSSSGKIYWGGLGYLFCSSPLLTVTENELTIAAPANSKKTFDILSNTNWTVTSNQTWLIASNSSGSGNSTITLTATVNPTIAARSATITVSASGLTNQSITVTQVGFVLVLSVSTNELTIAAPANSTKTFNITSNTSWTTSSNQTWLTVDDASGSGNSTITLTATANPTTATRTATVTVSGDGVSNQTVSVIQDAGTTGIIDITKKDFEIYPNPANNVLFINTETENVLVSIFDLIGNLLINKQATNSEIDISNLQKGIYIVKIENKNKLIIKRFVKD